MLFRNNINALRALAVIAVVLFHFRVPGFDGGFVGVDVFFVISGFLMTGIIVEGLRRNAFSLVAFYASRARRIIPALAVLCLLLMLFGFVYLPLDDYRELLRTAKNSLLFTSNLHFAEDGDYFSAPLHENWLLHTWSLSVEMQFYLFYPVLLALLFRLFGERGVTWALVLLCAASLAASVLLTESRPVAAFYLLPTRAWEMLLGGLVFLFPLTLSRAGQVACEVTGLALVLLAVLVFSGQDPWPGYLAVLPALGAALVIQANSRSLFSRTAALQWVGRISYSVYLWHWPLVVFLYTCGLLGSAPHVLAALLLTFALGAASYRWVESPARQRRTPSRTLLRHTGLALGLVVIAAVGGSLVKKYPQLRFAFVDNERPRYLSELYSRECAQDPADAEVVDCRLGAGEVRVILFGDSHAESSAAAVQVGNREAALSWSRGGCPTLIDFQMQDRELERKCHAFNQRKLDLLKHEYPGVPVVLLSRAALYSDNRRENRFRVFFRGQRNLDEPTFARAFDEEYARTVCSIAEQRPVYIVRPIPEMPVSVYKGLNLQARILGSKADISVPLEAYRERNRRANEAIDFAARRCQVQVLDPAPWLCPNGQCMGSLEGRALYFDDNHLVDSGNRQLQGMFRDFF
ncbi:acyltransferase family protein [Pseudomonas japonica]|uniref:acyltransferase family protein n=1 Tax=Pseudomonas japonica TaxID=256466 RepID=UPI003815E71D